MKSNMFKFTALLLLLAFAGCTTQPQVDKKVTRIYKVGEPGGTTVETYQTTARIIAIDPAMRQISFRAPDDSTNSFIAGPKFLNFESYHVGDDVNVSVARELSMYLGTEIPAVASDSAAIVRATPGVRPGILRAETIQISATVTSVNPEKQEATLLLPDGRNVNFKIRKDIDLTKVPVGSPVAIRTSEALAIMPQKP